MVANALNAVKSEMQNMMWLLIVEYVPGAVKSLMKTSMTGHKIVINVPDVVKPAKISTHG
jgi:hypothetical protein